MTLPRSTNTPQPHSPLASLTPRYSQSKVLNPLSLSHFYFRCAMACMKPPLFCTDEERSICVGVSSTNVNPSKAPSKDPKYAPRTSGETVERARVRTAKGRGEEGQTDWLNGGELLVELRGVERASKLWCPRRRDVSIVEQIPIQTIKEAMGFDLGGI
jgi:hypothetical protein